MNNHVSVTEQLTIEKDVPLPPTHVGIPRHAWPFAQMEPGDSFLVPCEPGKTAAGSRMSSISMAIRRHRKEHPDQVYTCRTVDGGVRCWRVA